MPLMRTPSRPSTPRWKRASEFATLSLSHDVLPSTSTKAIVDHAITSSLGTETGLYRRRIRARSMLSSATSDCTALLRPVEGEWPLLARSGHSRSSPLSRLLTQSRLHPSTCLCEARRGRCVPTSILTSGLFQRESSARHPPADRASHLSCGSGIHAGSATSAR